MRLIWSFVKSTALCLCFLSSSSTTAQSTDDDNNPFIIFAAASLTGALTEAGKVWAVQSGNPEPRISLAASAVLARQMAAGAPADLFISANQRWIAYLLQDDRWISDTLFEVAENRLVLAESTSDGAGLNTLSTKDIIPYSVQNPFVMADPNLSPAGEYTKTALMSMQLWDEAKNNAVYAGNVRQALALIERGGLPGFVYKSDLVRSGNVREVIEVPSGAHPTIRYIAAVPVNAKNRESAIEFLRWMTSSAGQDILVSHGFQPR